MTLKYIAFGHPQVAGIITIPLITGLAEDVKPTGLDNQNVGLFLETDTNKLYRWDNAWIEIPMGGTVAWGDLTGTLANQTDLQGALDSKSAASHTHPATEISDSTATGRSLVTATDAAAARTTLQLGTSATRNVGTLSTDVLQGDAVSVHEAASDPHTVYALDTDLSIHVGAADPHTVYQKESEKGAANGYASLGAGGLVPIAQLASGTPDGTKFIRDDGTLQVVSASAAWGSITGTLSNQTDLQSALDGKQPIDSDLTTIAGLTATSDNFIQSKASAWASRTVSQVKTDLGLTGTNSGDQTTIVGITGTIAQFNTACTDADFATGGGTATGTNTGDQTLPTDATIVTSDITTNNASTSKHGWMMKYPGGTTNFLRADGSFAAPPGGGSLAVTETEKDLGSTPAWRGKFTITDASISAGSKVLVWQAPGPYTGKGTRADECEMDWIKCHAVPASGSATVHWRATQGFSGDQGHINMKTNGAKVIGCVRGNVKFHYAIGA